MWQIDVRREIHQNFGYVARVRGFGRLLVSSRMHASQMTIDLGSLTYLKISIDCNWSDDAGLQRKNLTLWHCLSLII